MMSSATRPVPVLVFKVIVMDKLGRTDCELRMPAHFPAGLLPTDFSDCAAEALS